MATANKNLSDYDKSLYADAVNFKIGIAVSDWNFNNKISLFLAVNIKGRQAGRQAGKKPGAQAGKKPGRNWHNLLKLPKIKIKKKTNFHQK